MEKRQGLSPGEGDAKKHIERGDDGRDIVDEYNRLSLSGFFQEQRNSPNHEQAPYRTSTTTETSRKQQTVLTRTSPRGDYRSTLASARVQPNAFVASDVERVVRFDIGDSHKCDSNDAVSVSDTQSLSG